MFKALLVLACCYGVAVANPLIAGCGAERETEVDNCGQKLFLIGDRSLSYLPTNLEQMTSHCSQLSDSQNCIQNYSNVCVDGMAKQVLQMLVKGAQGQVVNQCDGDLNRQNFLTHTPCYNHKFNDMHICMENYIDHLQGLIGASKDQKIPLTCCHYYTFKSCIIDMLKLNPAGTCSASDLTYMGDMLDGFASEVLGLLCKNTQPDSDVCTTMAAPIKPASMARTSSILPPFVHSFQNF